MKLTFEKRFDLWHAIFAQNRRELFPCTICAEFPQKVSYIRTQKM